MSEKLLTIGIATYDDYDGLYFTIQALRMYQIQGFEDKVEFVVIDNNPDSEHGKAAKIFVTNPVKGKYIPYTDKKTTFTKYEVFNHASGKYTLIMDSHVLLQENAIKNLINYYENNPDTKNLITGPLWYDRLDYISTHFDPVWRGNMYGIWGTNKAAYDKGDPFEIEMMGTGLLSCKTSNWVGVNKHFKGFGAEEGYIHQKFRIAGGKCICIPQLKWVHRFTRPNGVPYPNNLEERIWNYFIGWLEILKDPNDPFFQNIFTEFKQNISEEKINSIFLKAQETLKNE